MAIKYTIFSINNVLKSTQLVVMWIIVFALSFVPKVPIFALFYFSIMAILIENSAHVKFPYRFILPLTYKEAVNGRLMFSFLTFCVQLLLFIIFAITQGEVLLPKFVILLTLVNCFGFIMTFFYTKKRRIISLILIGFFYAIITNVCIILVISRGNIGIGMFAATIISVVMWIASYMLSNKLAANQYV